MFFTEVNYFDFMRKNSLILLMIIIFLLNITNKLFFHIIFNYLFAIYQLQFLKFNFYIYFLGRQK